MTPRRLWKLPVDFFATREHYLEHLAGVWNAMKADSRGVFYAPAYLEGYAESQGLEASILQPEGSEAMVVYPRGLGPLVVASYGDMMLALRRAPQRPIIFMEHGVGISFGSHPGYSGGGGTRRRIGLFLDPNEHVRARNARAFPDTPGVVVGTPRLDWVKGAGGKWQVEIASASGLAMTAERPVVCVGFHWNGSEIAPEAGTAYLHYREALRGLARSEEFTLIGTGHPRYRFFLEGEYRGMGIEAVWDFREVMRRAEVYVNDCSSTLYEFLLTGKPVVLLNAPWFRRKVKLGIRFWEYTDIGPQVDHPQELGKAIRGQIEAARGGEDAYRAARERVAKALYPNVGRAAKTAARAIEEFTGRRLPPMRKVRTVSGQSIGIVYMAFGRAAMEGVMQSANSLARLGLDIPMCVVGDRPVEGMQFVEWRGESPFDGRQASNFQFRAGRVKPGLYGLSPFERTLYIDADTEFLSARVLEGWKFLDEYEMAAVRELLAIGELYNKPRAGWEINILERDATIEELGGDRTRNFINSGVIFFRKCAAVEAVFKAWGEEWLRWQQWDEQLALMRAMGRCEVKVKVLEAGWNHPHRDKAEVIFHNYGRAVVRSDVREVVKQDGQDGQDGQDLLIGKGDVK